MTSRFTFLVAALFVSGLLFVAMPSVRAQVACSDCTEPCGNGGKKVLICHIPQEDEEGEVADEGEVEEPTEICIAASALKAHCEHGDTCGSCDIQE